MVREVHQKRKKSMKSSNSSDSNPFGKFDDHQVYQDPEGRDVGRASYPGMEEFETEDDKIQALNSHAQDADLS